MKKPNIGITIGDYNGIGPEVTLKAQKNKKILKSCNIFLITDKEIIDSLKIPIDKKVNLHLSKNKIILKHGNPTIHSGRASLDYISEGIDLIKNNKIDCLVTAPISKTAISLAGSKFKGHTDLLQKAFKRNEVVMSFFSKKFNVSLATIHMPVKKISKSLTKELIINQVKIINDFLKVFLKSKKPRIGI